MTTTSFSSTYAAGVLGSVLDPLSSANIGLTVSGEVNVNSNTTSNWAGLSWATSASTSYLSPQVTNYATGYVAQTGYTSANYKAHTLTFSSQVSDVVMSIYSLGRPSVSSTLIFSQPFQILSSNGLFQSGGDATNGYSLTGNEGNGVIQFLGKYTSLSWNVTAPEYYSAFNIGMTSNPYTGYGTVTPYNFPSSELPTSFTGGGSTPDIVSTNNRTGSNSTGFNLLSNVGAGNFNNRFDGGTLRVDATSSSANFSITANKGTIDQYGNAATFSGQFTNDSAGVLGRLVISNSGTARQGKVVLSNVNNSYSGGTEVQAGAVLEIASAAALGSGGLDLVGSATVPATLSVTQSITLAKAITVTGDPVFNIAPATTTTITSAITDGASAGDVELTGGGTLALTAANTYTGVTTITSGTLALVGAGSIATSSAVTNNSTFDVTQASGNVALGGSYTQGASATLKTTLAPTNNQQVNVAGTASLGGTLDVTAAAGTYRAGRYTLLTSTGLGGSTFSALTSNLASVTNHSYSLAYDPNNVYLELRASVADTQASMRALAGDLNTVYNAQYGLAQLGLSYDCKLFDQNNVCVSTGARTTRLRADGVVSQGVALIGGYRPRADLRLGAWIDQNDNRLATANVQVTGSSPMVGAFGVWNEEPASGRGLELRASLAYGKQRLALSRPVVGTSEAGRGDSRLSTTVAEATVGYGMDLAQGVMLLPYAGLRASSQSHTGYTEGTGPFSPLTFATARQSIRSAVAGARLAGKPLDDQPIALELNAGVEHSLGTSAAQLSATGLAGLGSVQMTPTLSNNRPFASASLSYEIDKTQQLMIGLSHSKQFANSAGINSAVVRYVIGL